MTLAAIEPFESVLSNPHAMLCDLAGRGRGIVGYFCTFTPIELIHAAGLVPVRIMGGGEAGGRADSLVPDFICPYVRSAVENAASGKYDFLAGVVQGYSCDVTCGVTNIWKANLPGRLFHVLSLPYNDSPESRRFLGDELAALKEKLQAIGNEITEESLRESIELYSEIRALVLDLYAGRSRGEAAVSVAEMLTVVLAGFSLPPEDYLQLLETLSQEVKGSGPPPGDGPRVLLSGSIVEDPHLLGQVEDCGCVAVGDDLCSGVRHFAPPAGEGATAFERLVDRYFKRPPCPSRSRAEERAAALLDTVERTGARGVIFLLQKFCTPHLADHPCVADELKKHGIPSILIEMEGAWMDEGRMRTRLQAFIEMIA